MKVLVTGASGFVGKALCTELDRRGHSVRGTFRLPKNGIFCCEQFVTGNIDLNTEWSSALADVDVVVHLAARVHVMRDTAADPTNLFDAINNQATRKLVQTASVAGVKRFIYLSTVKVNGETTAIGRPFIESDVPAPVGAYALSKHHAEQGVREMATEYGLDWCIIRSPLVYGPGVKANFAALIGAVKRGIPLPLASVQNRRSLISLDNLVDFIATCVTHTAAANQMFLVSDGKDMSTSQLINTIGRVAGKSARLFPVPVHVLEIFARLLGQRTAFDRLCESLQVDIGKAKAVLHWVPPVELEDALRRAVNERAA